jgi:hypothetical protein
LLLLLQMYRNSDHKCVVRAAKFLTLQKQPPNKKAPDLSIRRFSLKLYLRLPTATATATTAVATASAATTAVASATAAAIAATAAAVATAAATTVAAAATAASAAATTVTAATTWWACFTWACFVHRQGAAFDRLAVELRDRVLRILVGRHRDERKAARLTRELILHERDFLHGARLSEKILKIGFGRVEGKISYV